MHANLIERRSLSPATRYFERNHSIPRHIVGHLTEKMRLMDTRVPAIPTAQRAVVIEAGDQVRIRENVPFPTLHNNEFLVRTDHVAVNPSDTKMCGEFVTPGGVLGTDYAGTVIVCGSEVTEVEVGNVVCGAQHCMNANTPLRGSFGEYNIPTGKIWLRLPDSISAAGGATFGAGISTAGLALKLLGLPLPDAPVEKPAQILVYGGSTATATIAIQLLRL